MHKRISFIIFIFFVFSQQAHASRLDLFTEPNGSLGPLVNFLVDDVGIAVNAYYYDQVTNEVMAGVVTGIDGIANKKHPAGIGAGKSSSSINPPGLDNVGEREVAGNLHGLIEFLVFSFDTPVIVKGIETDGLGPHGTNLDYWGGVNTLTDGFDMTNLGDGYSLVDTPSLFTPDSALGSVSWFAIGAKPEEDFNVFSIQTVQFSAAPASVPVPAAFWLFLTGVMGLTRLKKGCIKIS